VAGRLISEYIEGVLIMEGLRPKGPGRMRVAFPQKAEISKAEIEQVILSLYDIANEGRQVPQIQKQIQLSDLCFNVEGEQLRKLSIDQLELLFYHVQKQLLTWPEKADKPDLAYDFPE